MKRLLAYVLMLCLACTLVPTAVFADDAVTDNSHLITYEKPGTFDYYIDGDPMQIEDDEFFGVWDEELGDWSKKPYFRYDEFPEMIKVKEAAMDGDYLLAKDELLAYYLKVRDSRYLPITKNPGGQTRLRAQLLEKNVYASNGNGAPQGLVNFGNEWEEHRVSVSNAVINDDLIGYSKYVGFVLMSVDKHLTQAEVKARESGEPAYLELVVNGAPIRIAAAKDTMVRSGPYSAKNYGNDPIMTVQESGIYRNHNENTKRAHIAFDISFLKTTDNVTSAVLVFNGRNASGTGNKEILVYNDTSADYDEYALVFDDLIDHKLWSCNDQNTWDYYAAMTNRGDMANFLRGPEIGVCADMYSYSGQERYAYTYIRQEMGLVYNQGYNVLVLNELDMSTHLINHTKYVFEVLDSKYMTGEILTAIIKNFWLYANREVNEFFGTKDNNWGSFATYAVYSFIARFQEVAVYDEWYERAQIENERLVAGFLLEDGMSFELCQGYTGTMLGTLTNPFNVQNETGIPVAFTDTVFDTAYKLCLSLVFCSSPGFRGYGIGDSTGDYASFYGGNVKFWYNMVFQDDPILAYASSRGLYGSMPENPTTSYHKSLRTFMRSSWEDDAFAMSFINTDHNTASHGQYDHLSITLFAYGRYLLGDPGLGALGDTKKFQSSAPQHNLVTVNNSDHNKIYKTKELAFESNKMYDFIEYSGSYTQDVTQSRNVLYLKDQKFWIVCDYANPLLQNKENSFEQNWHMHPTCNISLDDETFVIQSNTSDINVDLIPVGTEDITAYLQDTTFFLKGGMEEANKKAVLKKTATGDVVYNTIILPRNINEEFEVTADVIDTGLEPTKVNAFSARIKNKLTGNENYYYYYHINDVEDTLEQNPIVNIGQFKTDASTMLIETDLDGNVISTFLMGSTFLEDNTLDEKVLFKSLQPVSAISYKKAGEIFNVYSSSLTEEMLDDITIYAPGQYNVRYEGTFIDGKKSGDYLYFGDTPIIDGGEEGNTGSSGSGSSGSGNTDKDHGSTGTGSSGTGSSGGGSTGGGSTGGGSNVTDTPVVVPPIQTEDIPQAIAKELDGHWGKEQIVSLYNDKIITGDNEGLRLSDSISRAEFTTLVVRALNLESAEYDASFGDVKSEDWFAGYIATAYKKGLVNGADGNFRPNDTITREEMCKIIASAVETQIELDEISFSDNEQISSWAVDGVRKAYSLGIIKGMDDGSFAPKNNALREQAFVMLARLIEKIK